MTGLFKTVLTLSVDGSWVILLLLLLRPLLTRLPRRYAYGLWAVAAFRLVCPFGFPSVISLFRIPFVEPGEVVIRNAMPEVLPAVMENTSTNALPVQIPQSAASSVNWVQIATVIWLAGMTVLALWGVFRYLRLRLRLRGATPCGKGVKESDRISSPFVMGGCIWLPFGLDEEARQQVLAHEKTHLKRLDPVWRLAGAAVLLAHWFNPLCHLAFWLFGRDMEMSCDEAVIRSADRHGYCTALVTVATEEKLLGPLSFGETAVKSRVKNILRWKPAKAWITVVAAVLFVAVAAACVTNGGKDTPADGKYIIANGQTGEDYDIGGVVRIENERLYYRSTEFDLSTHSWQKPPFDEDKWQQMLLKLEGAAPKNIDGCEYMELFVLKADTVDRFLQEAYRDPLGRPLELNMGTGVSTMFLLRQENMLYVCEYYEYEPGSTDPLSLVTLRGDRLVAPGSALDPTVETFAWLDEQVAQVLSLEGTEVAAKAEADPALYKGILYHRHIMQYLCHVMMTEGLEGEKGELMGVLFEDVLVRRFEEPVIPRGSMTAAEYLESYMAYCLENYSGTQLHNIKNASSPMLAYLTQYYDYGK